MYFLLEWCLKCKKKYILYAKDDCNKSVRCPHCQYKRWGGM